VAAVTPKTNKQTNKQTETWYTSCRFPRSDSALEINYWAAGSLPSKNVTTLYCATWLKALNKHREYV